MPIIAKKRSFMRFSRLLNNMRQIAVFFLTIAANLRNGSKLRVSKGPSSSVDLFRVKPVSSNDLYIGTHCIIRSHINFDRPSATVRIGDRCYIGASLIVCGQAITLEDDVVISWGVTIVDHDSHTLDWVGRSADVLKWGRGEKDWAGINIAPIVIKRRCWVGFGASILKGVTIGEGSVVAANAVVTKDVPPYSVVAGNPARIVRTLSPADLQDGK